MRDIIQELALLHQYKDLDVEEVEGGIELFVGEIELLTRITCMKTPSSTISPSPQATLNIDFSTASSLWRTFIPSFLLKKKMQNPWPSFPDYKFSNSSISGYYKCTSI